MNILGLSKIDSGCSYHRVVLPLGFMENIKAYVTNLPPQEVLAQGWDIVLYNRFSCFDKDWSLVKSDLQAKIVIDIDDDWMLPANHIASRYYENMNARLKTSIIVLIEKLKTYKLAVDIALSILMLSNFF